VLPFGPADKSVFPLLFPRHAAIKYFPRPSCCRAESEAVHSPKQMYRHGKEQAAKIISLEFFFSTSFVS
jgi:hypothetical protein